jgi:hypothetical protein
MTSTSLIPRKRKSSYGDLPSLSGDTFIQPKEHERRLNEIMTKQLDRESKELLDRAVALLPTPPNRTVRWKWVEALSDYIGNSDITNSMLLWSQLLKVMRPSDPYEAKEQGFDSEGEDDDPYDIVYDHLRRLAFKETPHDLRYKAMLQVSLAHHAFTGYSQDLVTWRGVKRPPPATPQTLQLLSDIVNKLDVLQASIKPKYLDQYSYGDLLKNPVAERRHLLKGDPYDFKTVAESLKEDTELMSETHSWLYHVLHAQPGDVYQANAFMSTSLVPEQARRFMEEDKSCCLIEVHIPRGTPCIYMTPFADVSFSGDYAEYEVLLPPCMRYAVLSRRGGVIRLQAMGLSLRPTLADSRARLAEVAREIAITEEARSIELRYGDFFSSDLLTFCGARPSSSV